MRKGRGFRLKGFSTGNGKTSKPLATGRQFGSKFDSPLSYTPDGVKPNPPKSNYVDQDAQDRADDIAHGDGISTPRPEATEPPPVDSGMPEVTPYSGDMTLSSIYGDQTWETLSPKTRAILEAQRSKPGWDPLDDTSHPDSHQKDTYLTTAEKKAGGNYRRYNWNSDFSTNLETAADRTQYNTDASRFARRSEAFRTTGQSSFTIFDPVTGERSTRNIRNPNFKPNDEQKVNLDKKPQPQSVSTQSKSTKKPVRGTQTKGKPTDKNKAKHKNYTERTGKKTQRGTGKTYEDVWATASDKYKAKYGGDKKKAIQAMKDWNKKQDEKKKNKNKKK